MCSPSSSMNPLLLASACSGSPRALGFLLSREEEEELAPHHLVPTQEFLDLLQGDYSSSNLVAPPGACDVEEGVDHQTTRPAAPLLDGVTIDGDTALHVLATCGDGYGFLSSADVVCRKARHILVLQNKKGDTPLHCAARAGRPRMVSRLIALAGAGDDETGNSSGDQLLLKEVVRKENKRKETALHEAVRLGSKHTAELLMAADPELASLPKEGMSPLYLAISLQRIDIAKSLYDMSGGNLSYSGPNGQNALHAAVLRGHDMTEMLLRWNIGLTTQRDENGSTPLHFATSALLRPRGVRYWIHSSWILWFPWDRDVWDSDGDDIPFNQVLQANLAQMYQADDKGLFPIHIAAHKGAVKAVISFLEKCRSIACLCDAKGRTFLHVAVEKNRWCVVSHACKTASSLSWIWNMQDNDGNTALHLAVKNEFKDVLCLLLENLETDINITNNNGETPLDLAESKILDGYFYSWNPRFLINSALKYCHAKHGTRHRLDHFEEKYIRPLDKLKEAEKLKTATQTLGLAAVLMVTVAFGASFTLPGGYKDNGTPALSGKYVFDAFVAANSLGFGCAGLATIHLMYAGTSIVDIPLRIWHFNVALFFAHGSATSLATAFVLGMYVTLAPVAYMTAIAICVVASTIALCGFMDLIRGYAVARALHARLGSRAKVIFAHVIILQSVVVFWPLVLSFISAAISAKHRHK